MVLKIKTVLGKVLYMIVYVMYLGHDFVGLSFIEKRTSAKINAPHLYG